MNRTESRLTRGGFTLPEILVGVAMVGVLSAVVLPTVIGQIAKGETQRVVGDLQAVEQAAGLFRSDVGKWPASIEHIVDATGLTGGTSALEFTNNYPSNIQTVWQGPYLARGDVGSGLNTSGGTILLDIANLDWVEANDESTLLTDDLNEQNFVTFVVDFSGVSQDESDLRAENVDLAVDGIAGLDLADETHGKIRYVTTSQRLYYLTSPAK